MHNRKFGRLPLAGMLAGILATGRFASATELSEREYLDEMPVVLSVTRLPQSAHDAPGAVTVIDADMIRRTGARELADVLKLVPGFIVAHQRGGDSLAVYHAVWDVYAARMQMYVDGRSVYSSFFLGDVHRGMSAVPLEEIERIEVLRGSNSASFGSNAFLGVINVITKSAADTQGVALAVGGGDGIRDNYLRVGWGGANNHWRLSTSRRVTNGHEGIYDDSRQTNVQVRGDLQPTVKDSVAVHAGMATHAFGLGKPAKSCTTLLTTAGTCDDNPERTDQWRNVNLRLVWDHNLNEGTSIQLSGGWDKETIDGGFLARQSTNFFTLPGPAVRPVALTLPFNAKGHATRSDLGFQRTDAFSQWRTVIGAQAVFESVNSPFFFGTDADQKSSQLRLFSNVEWRPSGRWTLNGGALWERHSVLGSGFAPRAAANYHLTDAHTVRAATTRSFRFPSLYSIRGNTNLSVALSPSIVLPVAVPGIGPAGVYSAIPFPYVRTTGNIKPETLITNEVGYLGEFRDLGLTVDARGFVERMNKREYAFGYDFVNFPGPTVRGLEYQLKWQPFQGTRILYGMAHMHQLPGRGDKVSETTEVPHRVGTLSISHDFPNGLNVGLVDYLVTPHELSASSKLRQLDLRVAYAFRTGPAKGEVALVTNAIGGGHWEVPIDASNLLGRYERRAFLTLKLAY